MPASDVGGEIEGLLGRVNNVKPREIENAAIRAGWTWDHTTGSHAIYVKEEFPPLVIKLHKLKGGLARRLLRQIKSSLPMNELEKEKEVQESHDGQEGD